MTKSRQANRPTIARKLTILRSKTPAALICLALLPVTDVYAQQWHATADIEATAERFIIQQGDSRSGETSVQAGNIDSRHRLALCGEPLQAFLRRGTRIGARTIVGVRCTAPQPWKIYVPVDVVVTQAVLATKHALPRNHVLSAADFHAVERDVAGLRRGYYTDPQQASGMRLKTALVGGQVITPSMLQASLLIHRGQTVTLLTGNGQYRIQVKGIALMDGALQQRIRVENSSSGRVVEGIVRSAEHVEILTASSSQLKSIVPKDLPAMADTGLSNNDR